MTPTAGQLFVAYFQVGISGFGGANAWARHMLVEKRGWLTDAEYAQRLGLGQVLPGPNAMNCAIIIGYEYAGVLGALAAVGGMFLGPLSLLCGLAALYDAYGDLQPVRAALAGVAAGAAGMMLGTALKLARRSKPSWPMWLVLAAALGASMMGVSIGWILLVLGPLGILTAKLERP
jgi:chromate transporter